MTKRTLYTGLVLLALACMSDAVLMGAAYAAEGSAEGGHDFLSQFSIFVLANMCPIPVHLTRGRRDDVALQEYANRIWRRELPVRDMVALGRAPLDAFAAPSPCIPGNSARGSLIYRKWGN